jgi:predicted DNA-binding protein (MmcQ/YjbR family)
MLGLKRPERMPSMRDLQELVDYCLDKEGAVIDFPFGDIPVCVKFEGRIFAEIYPNESNYKITLRCEPDVGERYRNEYPGIVLPGYHVPLRQRKFKNTVLLDGDLPSSVLKEMIDHSYGTLRAQGAKRGVREGPAKGERG